MFLWLYPQLQKTRAQWQTEAGFHEAKIFALSEHIFETGHYPLWNEVKIIDQDSPGIHGGTKKLCTQEFTAITSTRKSVTDIPEAGCRRTKNATLTTEDRYGNGRCRYGNDLGKQLAGTARIENPQPTIVLHMVTHNRSTSSPDEH